MPQADAVDRKAKECPLCGVVVPGGAEGMNRHFGTDCTWRHTSKTPVGRSPAQGRDGA